MKGKKEKMTRQIIVVESYVGVRELKEIFADLLYEEYCRQQQKEK